MTIAHVTIAAQDARVSKSPREGAAALAYNVRRLRVQRGWTQPELAERANVSSVSMIESGARMSPRPETLDAIAGALGVTVGDLYAEPPSRSDNEQHSLDEFLSSPMAADISEDERSALKEVRWPLGEPTVKSWFYMLEAIRSTQNKTGSP